MKNEYYIDTVEPIVHIYINTKKGKISTRISLGDFHIADSINGTWHINGGYVTSIFTINKSRHIIRLHRLIMNAPEDKLVDHWDRNPLNNIRTNLRIVTEQENLKNKGIYKNTKSGIKGVCFNKQTEKWRATISGLGNGKQKHLGSFNTMEEAETVIKEWNMTQG